MDAVTATQPPAIAQPASVPLAPRPSAGQRLWRLLTAHWTLLVLVAVASAVADFWNLGGPSLWYDEAFSVELARQPIEVVWHYIWGPEPNMEVYYLLLHDWINLLGALGIQPNEFMLRLPSALFGVLGAVVLYQLGTRFFGGRFVGVVAALLYILNRDQISAAQQVRAYPMEVLLVCLLAYVFLEALLISRRPKSSWRTRLLWWGAYVVVASLVPYVHLFSGLVLASQGVLFVLLLVLPGVWRSAAWRSLPWAGFSFSLVILALIPAVRVSTNGPKNVWVGSASPSAIWDWLRNLSNGETAYEVIAVAIIAAVLLGSVIAWVRGMRGGPPRPQPGMLALVCWFVIPAAIAYVLTQHSLNLHLFYERYLVAVGPAWWLLIAFSLNQLRRISSIGAMLVALIVAVVALDKLQINPLLVVAVALVGLGLALVYERAQQVVLALVLLGLAALGTPSTFALAQQQNYRGPAEWLQAHYQPGDGIFCYPNDTCFTPMNYYFWAYPGKARFEPDAPGTFDWATHTYQNYSGLYPGAKAYALRHDRLFFVSARLLKDRTNEKAIMAWLAQRYMLVGQYSSTVNYIHPLTVTVQLYVKNPAGP